MAKQFPLFAGGGEPECQSVCLGMCCDFLCIGQDCCCPIETCDEECDDANAYIGKVMHTNLTFLFLGQMKGGNRPGWLT